MDVHFTLSIGTNYKMEVGFFDKVAEMKEMLEKRSSVPAKKQIFLFEGQLMEDDNDVQFYRLYEGCYIDVLVAIEAGKVRVNVKATEHFTLEIDKSDSVLTLKEKIHQRIKIPKERLALFYSKVHLRDHATVGEYGISGDSTINVMLKLAALQATAAGGGGLTCCGQKASSKMKIMVEQSGTHKTISVEVKPSDTVSKVKEKVQSLGFPAREHFFVHEQRTLCDKNTLEYYGVEEGNTLTIFPGSVTSASNRGYTDG